MVVVVVTVVTHIYIRETSVVFHLYNTHIRPISHVLTIYMAFLLSKHKHTQTKSYSWNRSDMSLKLLLLDCFLSNLDNFLIYIFEQMTSYWILLFTQWEADELHLGLGTIKAALNKGWMTLIKNWILFSLLLTKKNSNNPENIQEKKKHV